MASLAAPRSPMSLDEMSSAVRPWQHATVQATLLPMGLSATTCTGGSSMQRCSSVPQSAVR
eukprot:61578-Rhodomonas_salina.1